MGCFSVQHERRPKLSQVLSFSKPESLPTNSTSQCSSFCISPARPCHAYHCSLEADIFYSRSSPLRHSASFNLTHSRAPFGASPLTKLLNSHRASCDASTEDGVVRRCSSHGYCGDRFAVYSPSSPATIFSGESERCAAEARLFRLPLPPSSSRSSSTSSISCSGADEASSGSGSSVCAASPSGTLSRLSHPKSGSRSSPSLTVSTEVNQSAQSWQPSPLPLPLPPEGCLVVLREFSNEELAGACLNFAQEFFVRDGGLGPVFKTIIKKHEPNSGNSFEVAVTRFTRPGARNNFKKWRLEVKSLSLLSHPHLCKVVGFSGASCSAGKPLTPERERLLVCEHPINGSLDSWLYCRNGNAPMGWVTRLKIALGAAQGLACLHNRISKKVVYKSFKCINIQLSASFDAKLSDYGFVSAVDEREGSSPHSPATTWDDGQSLPGACASNESSVKGNVWSFGIVLLELMTGRQNMDDFFPPEERDLVRWCRPYLLDSKRLYLIMDPELKGRYSTRAAKAVADVALRCLAKDPLARPSMHDVAERLSSICSGMTNACGGNASAVTMCRSYSLASVLASPARVFAGRRDSPRRSPSPRILSFS